MKQILTILMMAISVPAIFATSGAQAADPIEMIRQQQARRYGFNQVAERQNEYPKSSKQFTEGIRSAKPTIADTP